MPIRAGSRYEGVKTLRDEHGNPYFGRMIPADQSTEYLEHLVSEGERMDTLAAKYLGDPTRWWEIAIINPEVLDFEAIEPGTRLRIPRVRAN